MRVHSYYMSKGPKVPARELIEVFLMEEFNWTPQEIANIPYKKLQMLFVVRNQKTAAQDTKKQLDKFKSENQTSGRGQMKRSYREV